MEPIPLPNIINEEEEYEIKEIRKYQKRGREMQFLVHWKGYGDKYNQWIVEKRLSYAKEVIEDYWTRISSQNL